MDEEKKVGEMFCGIGGFRYALETTGGQNYGCAHQGEHKEAGSGSANNVDAGRNVKQNGYRVVWANDNNEYACQVYRRHWNDGTLVEADIRDVKTTDIPDIDLLCAGFPCPTFSYAGKRAGFSDSRGTLFAQIVRVASAKRPKFLLMENVRGLLSSGDGRDFAIFIRVLGSLGYILQWEVLNSKYFGVPQTRERVFIVGHLGEKCFRQIFPLEEDDRVFEASRPTPCGQGQRVRSGSDSGDGGERGEEEVVADTVNARYYKGGPENLILQQHSYSGDGGRGRGFRAYSDIVPTLASQMGTGGNNVPIVANPTCVVAEEAVQPGRTDPRWLTEKECERLQSFPDNWTAEGLTKNGVLVNLSRTQRLKLIGNAVTCNVVRYVAERLFV